MPELPSTDVDSPAAQSLSLLPPDTCTGTIIGYFGEGGRWPASRRSLTRKPQIVFRITADLGRSSIRGEQVVPFRVGGGFAATHREAGAW